MLLFLQNGRDCPRQAKEKQHMHQKASVQENPSSITIRWLRVNEAAAYLRVSPTFMNRARITKIPDIPYVRIGRRVLYDRLALDVFLESQANR
jgi:hypothetical protein